MTQRKICGFDVNGWRDIVARNWSALPGEEEEIGETVFAESGPLSSIVMIGDGKIERWVGGRQADVAPHGNGGGWGEVGREDRRHSVRALLEGRIENPAGLASTYEVAGKSAAYNVVSIDDAPETTELYQERLLAALATAKLRNPMLVWRSVLAVLHAIETGLVSMEQTVGVISQSRDGLSIQKLRLRRAHGRNNQVIAPERRQVATIVGGTIGYGPLVRKAREIAIGPDGFTPRTAHLARARSVGRLAMGLPCDREILRQPNGDWDNIDLAGSEVISEPLLDEKLPPMDDCAIVIVETLVEGTVRQSLASYISRNVTPEVEVLPVNAVAHGALVAARRLGDGDPVYFDFLPRLSTIVFGQDGAGNFDLIDETETLEAGRVYRSPKPANFAIPAGHSSVPVYLRKEAEPNPRVATVNLETPLKEPSPVSLWVEQKPAAGRARIVLEAPGLGRHFTIDWDQAQDDERSWEEIIADLETPPPSIPERLVLKCGMRPWEDSNRADGLFSLLHSETGRARTDWDSLANQLAARPYGEYCISSDGALPPEVSTKDVEQLNHLTRKALDTNLARLNANPRDWDGNNAALKFLTWQFRRCPPEVVDWLLECAKGRGNARFTHPFVQHHSSWTLIYQGLGRVARDEETERRILKLLLATQISSWNWRVETAAAAFLLSRSDTAPMLLERSDVKRLTQRTVMDFEDNLHTEYTRFNYAPFLLAGLLRWRLKEPQGLLLGQDPLATKLANAIERVERDFETRRRPSVAFQKKKGKYLPILADLRSELEGRGGNPDLLLDIYGVGG